jgi:hypothetical protein
VLGVSAALLQKALRFYHLYPRKQAYQELERRGVDWTLLYVAFAVRDPEKRHQLLEKARAKDWTIPQLRAHIRARYTDPRRRRGGRPRKKLPRRTPELILLEVEPRCQYWLEFYAQSWSSVEPAGWDRLVQNWPHEDRERLGEILENADQKVAQLIAAGKAVRACVADLLRKV